MIALLQFWREGIIAVLLIAAGVQRLEIANLKTIHAKEQIAAAKLQADTLQQVRDEEAKSAALTSKMDANYAQYLASVDATRGDFERRLALKLRERGPACRDGVPRQTPDPGGAAPSSPGSDHGPGSADFDAGRKLRDAVKVLQGTVLTCVAWAGQNGR